MSDACEGAVLVIRLLQHQQQLLLLLSAWECPHSGMQYACSTELLLVAQLSIRPMALSKTMNTYVSLLALLPDQRPVPTGAKDHISI
jgi:hypothetical protein